MLAAVSFFHFKFIIVKILNLYSGIGGNRELWGNEHDITAVELDEKRASKYQLLFPYDTVIVADAHEYLLDNFRDFDFIWSSPPCQTHSRANYFLNNGVANKNQRSKVMNKFDLYKLSVVARLAGVEPRTLTAAVKKYKKTGEATPTLSQVNDFLANFQDDDLIYDVLATSQMQSYLADLRRMKDFTNENRENWTTGRILSVALLEFWHSKSVARCTKCETAICYPDEIVSIEENKTIDIECSRCGTVNEVKI